MNKWLIKYLPGARGDFLSNILGNDVHSLKTFYKLPPSGSINLIKIHALELGIFSRTANTVAEFIKELDGDVSYNRIFEVCKNTNRRTVRIVTNTDQEKLDAVCMNYIKNHVSGNPPFFKFGETDHQEHFKQFYKNGRNTVWVDPIFDDDTEHIDKYDEIVNFNDLYDVDFLVDFYKKHTNKEPDFKLISAIKYNIASNPRYSQSEFYAKG